MSELHTRWLVEVKTLSPLHIGSGAELTLGYDLVPHGGYTYRVNEDAMLEAALVQAEEEGAEAVNRVLAGRPAAELLAPADFDTAALFRYTLVGEPDKREGKIPEQLKDVYDRPYLPGSSLKGALRTILAWGFYVRRKSQPDLQRLRRSRSWAFQDLERQIFGRDPNRDVLRALHVEDSAPVTGDDVLALEQVQVYPGGTPIDIETVREGVTFRLAISVDESGFRGDAAQQLGWQGKRSWLDQLPGLGKAFSRQRLLTEAEFFNARGEPRAALAFYDGLARQVGDGKLAKDEFLVQVGWGTGWESKTLGSGLLRQDDASFERLLGQYRMTKERRRKPGDPFPKSRTLALRQGQPALPLGWVQVKLVGLEASQEPVALSPQPARERAPSPPPGRRQRPQDLQPGQVLEGKVRNIAAFGAFVDIGVGRDGLVHISQLSEEYVDSVESVVQVGQRVRVRVLSVEQQKGQWRISLAMKGVEQE